MQRRQQPSFLFVAILGVLAIVAAWRVLHDRQQPAAFEVPAADNQRQAGDYLFCFWNVENLFDDEEDPRLEGVDREMDQWFAENPQILKLKLDHLSDALLKLNNGTGPDILAMVEVEGFRAADLLRQALNKRISEPAYHYQQVIVKDTKGLRHISPAILSRVPVDGSRTRVLGRGQRILENHLTKDGDELVVIACHWTSRITDKEGDARGRYADQIYGAYRAMWQRNPKVDCLVCGDFNDTPNDVSVIRHLHATGDRAALLEAREQPRLFNLLAGHNPEMYGTHFFQQLLIFDQITVSPGMLDDDGWACDPNSVEVVNWLTRPTNRRRRPWAFGRRNQTNPRGYSDHFPVTVRLRHTGNRHP